MQHLGRLGVAMQSQSDSVAKSVVGDDQATDHFCSQCSSHLVATTRMEIVDPESEAKLPLQMLESNI